MHLLTSYPYTEVELIWNRRLPGSWQDRARQLRGALARLFHDDSRFHQHDADGNLLYRYPPVLYRWVRDQAVVCGWGDAAALLPNLTWLDLEITLGDTPLAVEDAVIRCRTSSIGYSPRLHSYHLRRPVLLFNQDNFPRFLEMSVDNRRRELERLLTAQLLTALRGLGAEVPGHLYALLVDARSQNCSFKQQQLLGFTGRLICNLELPRGFAFGHAISHGYGWLEPHQEGR